MRALVQRVSSAAVRCVLTPGEDPVETGRIGPGLVVLVGVTHGDDRAGAARLAEKLYHLRILADDDGAMNRSCAQTGAGLLVVSQFTLYADTARGRRPSFVDAAPPEQAEPLVDHLVERLVALGATVATGTFRTQMELALVNDGPVTLQLEV